MPAASDAPAGTAVGAAAVATDLDKVQLDGVCQ